MTEKLAAQLNPGQWHILMRILDRGRIADGALPEQLHQTDAYWPDIRDLAVRELIEPGELIKAMDKAPRTSGSFDVTLTSTGALLTKTHIRPMFKVLEDLMIRGTNGRPMTRYTGHGDTARDQLVALAHAGLVAFREGEVGRPISVDEALNAPRHTTVTATTRGRDYT